MTAIYTTRGEDNIIGNIGQDGSSVNIMTISRMICTLEKCNEWKLTSLTVNATTFNIIAIPAPDAP